MRIYSLKNDFVKNVQKHDKEFLNNPRGYIFVNVEVGNKIYLIPLRSNLNHRYGFKYGKGGLDFSKSFLLVNKSILNKEVHYHDKKEIKYYEKNIKTISALFKRYLSRGNKDYAPNEKIILKIQNEYKEEL